MSENTPTPLLNLMLGDYLLTEELGSGGMATVYRAIRQSDRAEVAVKVMSQELKVSEEFIHRFRREANLMKSFDHPHILPVYDFGQQGKYTYLVMAVIGGGTLRQFAQKKKPTVHQLLPTLKQIASALDYAHERNVVHRDLKPSNILMDKDGLPYLADFGIAKFREESIGLTLTGMVLGTPGYMAPEQWRSEHVSAQTDIYSFGVMLYELLGGKMPFTAATPFSLMYLHLDEPPPTLSSLRPDLPPTIDRVLRRAMAKVPEKRYPTVSDVVRALNEALSQEPTRPAARREKRAVSSEEDHIPTTALRRPGNITLSEDEYTFTPIAGMPSTEERTFTPVDKMMPAAPSTEERTFTPIDGILSTEERTFTPIDGARPSPVEGHTVTPDGMQPPEKLTFTSHEFEEDFDEPDYNAVDVGARVLLQRAREAARELSGEGAVLAGVVVQYVEDLRERAKSSSPTTPYRALESYDLADHKLFFGREQAVDAMLARSPHARLTILHAESGAGKTSLIRAGLMPRLLAGGFLPLYVAVRRSTPHDAIKSILLPNAGDAPTFSAGSLRAYLKELVGVVGAGREIFIFIDQFETFLTDVFSVEQRAQFISELAECLDDELLPIRVTLAMRTEYFGLLSSFQPTIAQPFSHEFLLRALTVEEARRALLMPARVQGYEFSDGLHDLILSDLDAGAGEVEPPQLQLVGSALVDLLPPERKQITLKDYEEAGRAEGVLRGYLEGLLARFPTGQRQVARLVIEGLVRADQTRDVRTAASLRGEIESLGVDSSPLEAVLLSLRENRVLRLVEVDDESAYELVHDYLARQVQLDPAATARKAAQELLERRVGDYQRYGSLLTEQEMEVIEAQRESLRLDEVGQRLLGETRDRLLRQKRRQRALAAVALLGLIGALILGLVAAVRESQNQQERANLSATSQARIAAERDQALTIDSRRLADAAGEQLAVDPVTSLNLAMEAFTPRDRPYVAEAEFALSRAVQHSTERLYLPSEQRVNGALWNADQSQVITWSEDGTLRFFDGVSGQEIQRMSFDSGITAAAFSPDASRLVLGLRDGRAVWMVDGTPSEISEHSAPITGLRWNESGDRLLSWGQDGLVILWDADGEVRYRWLAGALPVVSAGWSPDEASIATLSEEIVIWNAASGQEHVRLRGHVNRINGFNWSPEGERLVSFSDDFSAIVWDVENGTPLLELAEHSGGVTSASWSPAGDTILTTGFDGAAFLWDAATGEIIHRAEAVSVLDGAVWNMAGTQTVLFGESAATRIWDIHTGQVIGWLDSGETDTVYGARWNADESALLTYTQSGLVHLWRGTGGRPLQTFAGHTGSISSANWNLDGTKILTTSGDASARVWAVHENGVLAGSGIAQEFSAAHGQIFRAMWNADETQIAAAYEDGSIIIWDVSGDTPPQTLTGHTDIARFLAWNPQDATRLLSGSDDGTARIWQGEQATVLEGHTAALTSASWRADGVQVLTTSEDATARVWDATSGAEILTLTNSGAVWNAAWSPDFSQVATAGADGHLSVWDALNGELVRDIEVGSAPLLGVSWSADGSRLLVWGYDTWDPLESTCRHASLSIL